MTLIIILVLLAMLSMAGQNQRGFHRVRTPREGALHNDIQRAMNWNPRFPRLRKDGRLVNAYGEEFESFTLGELLKREGIPKPDPVIKESP